MTSPSSGYFTLAANSSLSSGPDLMGKVSVPAKTKAVISLKEAGLDNVAINVDRHCNEYDLNGQVRERKINVWYRPRDMKSDFAQVFNATEIVVSVRRESCIQTKSNCFWLFFSFFTEDRAPQKLPSGLWNCSVDHYASFRHHMDCNHEIECEDAQDETEHCSFSSPSCQGLVAFCNSCYKFIKRRNHDVDHYTDSLRREDKYCHSLGGRSSFPACMCDWIVQLRNMTKMHGDRLDYLWLGCYSNDISLQNMYRQEVLIKRTVLHHFIKSMSYGRTLHHEGIKTCWYTDETKSTSTLCSLFDSDSFFGGIVCEFSLNKTEMNTYPSKTISSSKTCVWPAKDENIIIKCPHGHVTYTFLACGTNQYRVCEENPLCSFSDPLSYRDGIHSANYHAYVFPMFSCSDEIISLSYTLVCDFLTDCADKSDESACKYPFCVNTYTCSDGQCLPFSNLCDQVSHCYDDSDENHCKSFRRAHLHIPACIPSPALVNFNGVNHFSQAAMNDNESCPDSHYRCPGDVNDCLPVYTRCNGIYDCLDHQDEAGCEALKCLGLFRCRMSMICVHYDHLCDDWPHCPMRDDEYVCGLTCPVGCLCQGHTFLCFKPFSTALFSHLRYLDATGTGMTLLDVNNHARIFKLILAKCALTFLPKLNMLNLRILDVSGNNFQYINVTNFLNSKNLKMLSLSDNPLTSLCTDHSQGFQHHTLTTMDLSHTSLTVLGAEVFSVFPNLLKLNMTFTSIHTISPKAFQSTQHLTELYMDGSPVKTFSTDIFKGLSYLQVISSHNHKFCCDQLLPRRPDELSCYAPEDAISSCKDLLQSWAYRVFLWLIGWLSLTGNVFCFCTRLFTRSMTSSTGFSVFVTNLTMADFLMGVYIVFLGAADERFRGRYLYHDDMWKSSISCKVAGVLCLVSSEVSAMVIWLITLDRFMVLHFPFSTLRFERASAGVACLLTWLLGWVLALIPLLPMTSHWEFYSQTGICIPLPTMKQKFRGQFYSVSILIILNCFLFILIFGGQAFVYWSIQSNAFKINSTKVSQDMTIARRLITVAMTDFMCWFPIAVCGISALAGTPIPGEVNVALAIFVLPLNSAVNPFVYTFNTLAEKRRKSNEAKLLKFLESHADILVSK